MAPASKICPVVLVLVTLWLVGCDSKCPTQRARGVVRDGTKNGFMSVGERRVKFTCEINDCGSLTPQQCDSKNLILTWKFWPCIPSSRCAQNVTSGIVPQSARSYPSTTKVSYTNTSLPLMKGEFHLQCSFPSEDPDSSSQCYVATGLVKLGEPPAKIGDHDLQCYAYNYVRLECHWCPDREKSDSNWDFHYTRVGDSRPSYCRWNDCVSHAAGRAAPKQDRCCRKGCTIAVNYGGCSNGANCAEWNRVDYLVDISRKNGYGNTSQRFERSFREQIIVPSPVNRLRVVKIARRSLEVGWSCPSTDLNIVNLVYEINVTSLLGSRTILYEHRPKCQNTSTVYKQLIDNLYPHVNYTISARVRAQLSKYWSNSTLLAQYTAEDVPSKNPETRPSGYRTVIQPDGLRQISLYYKDIPVESMGGQIRKVVLIDEETNKMYPCDNKERECVVADLMPDQKYTFVVQAKTDMGSGPIVPTSRFTLPRQDDSGGLSPPDYFAVESLSSADGDNRQTRLNFTWMPTEVDNKTLRHIIYYRACKSYGDICEGGLKWWEVPAGQTTFTQLIYHPDHSVNDYRFSIAVEDDEGATSGMMDWTSCVYKVDGSLTRPPVPTRASDSVQNTDSLTVLWDEQTCPEGTEGRINAYTVSIVQVTPAGNSIDDGHIDNRTVPPNQYNVTFSDLVSGTYYNVTLTSHLRSRSFRSASQLMMVKTPASSMVIPIVITVVILLLVVVAAIPCYCIYRRYRRINNSAHDFAKPEIDDQITYIVSRDEDYLMPELSRQTPVANGTESNSSSVSGEHENAEDRKLLPVRNGPTARSPGNSLESDSHYTTGAPSLNGHVIGQELANGSVNPVPSTTHNAVQSPASPPSSMTTRSPPRVPIKLVPVSPGDEDSGYCRFGEPGEPNAVTVAMLHQTHQRPNLKHQPFADKEKQLKEFQKQQQQRQPSPEPDNEYSKVGLIYLPPRLSSTDSNRLEREVSPPRDKDGYLVPNQTEPCGPTLNMLGYVVNNDTYGLESPSSVHSDDVFDFDQSDNGVRIDLANHNQPGDGYIPKPDVPLSVYDPDKTSSVIPEVETPTLTVKTCDWPSVSQSEEEASPPLPAGRGNDVIPNTGRPDSYHDSGYVSNDSLPKPKPSSESVTLSDVDEGYDERGVSNDRDSPTSPPIQSSSPSPLTSSRKTPDESIMNYVTLDDVQNGSKNDVIMV